MSEKPEYAKGLAGVIANESCLSDVQGEAGILRYLGYNIDDLVENCTFEEVMYFLNFVVLNLHNFFLCKL